MTRRELINQLLDGDMNEEIFVAIVDAEGNEEQTRRILDVDVDVLIVRN